MRKQVPRIPPIVRFERKIKKLDTGCWIWTGAINDLGYGRFNSGEKAVLAHRWNYEWHKGPIQNNLPLDHLCRTPACCNPDHLEPVTQRENVYRGKAPNVIAHIEGRCRRGHKLTPDNLVRAGSDRAPICRICRAESKRRSYLKGKYNAAS